MNYNCERCGDRLGWREHQGPTLCERCRLRAEVERLQRSADGWRDDALRHAKNAADLKREVERLRAELEEGSGHTLTRLRDEVERLRAALERIANGGYEGRGDSSLSPGGVARFTYTKKGLRAIARAALTKEES